MRDVASDRPSGTRSTRLEGARSRRRSNGSTDWRRSASSPNPSLNRFASAAASDSNMSSIAARTATAIQKSSSNSAMKSSLLLIDAERDLIINLYRAGELNDEARRRVERELDLREARLANLRAEE